MRWIVPLSCCLAMLGLTPAVWAVDIQTNIGSYESPQTLIDNTAQINCGTAVRYRTVRVQGNSGAVDLTSNPQILAGTAEGQRCTICGAHASHTIKLDDGTGVDLSIQGGSLLLVDDPTVAQICADFVWTGSVWRQTTGAVTGADNQTAAEVAFTPAGAIAATDVQEALEEVDAETIAYFSHATDCRATVTTASVGDVCLDLDDGKFWRCQTPSGGASETLCDEADDWVGGFPLSLDANQTLTYHLSDGSKAIMQCNDTDYDAGTFCHRWTIDPTSGPRYAGVCGFSTPGNPTTPQPCETEIPVASGKDLTISYAGDPILQMAAGSHDLRPTTDGWLSPRSGTASPSSGDCNAAGEAGRVYIDTDESDSGMVYVCDGAGWRQQGWRLLTKSIVLFDPVTGDTGKAQWIWPGAVTITRVDCSTNVATSTVTINLDERALATPDTNGTDTLSAGLVCDTGNQSSCASGCDVNTITDASIAAGVPHALEITAVANAPTVLRVHVTAILQ